MVQVVASALGETVNTKTHYTLYHPKWYRPHVSVWWWLKTWSYTKFVLREMTSLSVAYFAMVTLWQVSSLARGPEAYLRFLERMKNPFIIGLNLISLFFVLFHALTWFHLAPKALVLRLGGRRLPDSMVVGMNYVVWLIACVLIAWIMLRG